MRRARRDVAAVLTALAIVGGACAGSDSSAGPETPPTTAAPDAFAPVMFPGADWTTADPASVGVDPAAVEDVATFLEAQESSCMAIVKDGQLIGERYWNDSTAEADREIFSASKSVTSTLVGIAQDEGHLDIDDKASTYLTEWQGTPSEDITIRNLVSNDSGRYWDFQTDYGEMAVRAPDKTAFAIGLDQQFPPGEHWEYNNSAIQTLEGVLERATGVDMGEYASEKLFAPIGMGATYNRDASGNALAFMGVQASCRDLARFGYLFLNRGSWDGMQIVSEEWVAEATTSSQSINSAYGFLWWLNAEGPIVRPGRPVAEGPIWPSLPTNAFAALGLGNQIVLVLPDEGIVVVREGPSGGSVGDQGNFVEEIGSRLVPGLPAD